MVGARNGTSADVLGRRRNTRTGYRGQDARPARGRRERPEVCCGGTSGTEGWCVTVCVGTPACTAQAVAASEGCESHAAGPAEQRELAPAAAAQLEACVVP